MGSPCLLASHSCKKSLIVVPHDLTSFHKGLALKSSPFPDTAMLMDQAFRRWIVGGQISSKPERCLGVKAGSSGACTLHFLRGCKAVFQHGSLRLHSCPQCLSHPTPLCLCQHLVLSLFLADVCVCVVMSPHGLHLHCPPSSGDRESLLC